MNFITKDVLYTSRDIKEEAKAQLRGNWLSAIFLAMIPVIFTIIFMNDTRDIVVQDANATIQTKSLIINIFQSFLQLGVTYTFMDFVRNRNKGYVIQPLQGVIQPFRQKYILKLILLSIVKYLLLVLWTLLLIVPGIVKYHAYSQAEKIYKDQVDLTGEQPNPLDCIRASEQLMKGHKLSLFTLNLSFIGWYILAAFTMGIGFIWLTPYVNLSETIFYENISGGIYSSDLVKRPLKEKTSETKEEIGKDADDFRDFDDF